MKLSSFSIVAQTVAAWLPGVSWSYNVNDYAYYYAIQFEGAEAVDVSETALYYGMNSPNVSDGGTI